uniref:Uncharacterized protein n=1 Tax=Triticum urartu TaxID=4572 RepID=A0A8R7TFM8_TRIUA
MPESMSGSGSSSSLSNLLPRQRAVLDHSTSTSIFHPHQQSQSQSAPKSLLAFPRILGSRDWKGVGKIKDDNLAGQAWGARLRA